ncbi:813_t:CDS:2 [Ambispora leptoticha]|uniref:813_t:CDS:1 n=1 Tax=Ambispora leptoticha TaxID=144679 RepID=A0A9N8V9B6_9GLOM|nr:813_t:CDS:2 [Ambispora leptoticha]
MSKNRKLNKKPIEAIEDLNNFNKEELIDVIKKQQFEYDLLNQKITELESKYKELEKKTQQLPVTNEPTAQMQEEFELQKLALQNQISTFQNLINSFNEHFAVIQQEIQKKNEKMIDFHKDIESHKAAFIEAKKSQGNEYENDANNSFQLVKDIERIQGNVVDAVKIKGVKIEIMTKQADGILSYYHSRTKISDDNGKLALSCALQRFIVRKVFGFVENFTETLQLEKQHKDEFAEQFIIFYTQELCMLIEKLSTNRIGSDGFTCITPIKIRQQVYAALGARGFHMEKWHPTIKYLGDDIISKLNQCRKLPQEMNEETQAQIYELKIRVEIQTRSFQMEDSPQQRINLLRQQLDFLQAQLGTTANIFEKHPKRETFATKDLNQSSKTLFSSQLNRAKNAVMSEQIHPILALQLDDYVPPTDSEGTSPGPTYQKPKNDAAKFGGDLLIHGKRNRKSTNIIRNCVVEEDSNFAGLLTKVNEVLESNEEKDQDYYTKELRHNENNQVEKDLLEKIDAILNSEEGRTFFANRDKWDDDILREDREARIALASRYKKYGSRSWRNPNCVVNGRDVISDARQNSNYAQSRHSEHSRLINYAAYDLPEKLGRQKPLGSDPIMRKHPYHYNHNNSCSCNLLKGSNETTIGDDNDYSSITFDEILPGHYFGEHTINNETFFHSLYPGRFKQVNIQEHDVRTQHPLLKQKWHHG